MKKNTYSNRNSFILGIFIGITILSGFLFIIFIINNVSTGVYASSNENYEMSYINPENSWSPTTDSECELGLTEMNCQKLEQENITLRNRITELKHQNRQLIEENNVLQNRIQTSTYNNQKQITDYVIICTSPNAYVFHNHRCQGLNRCKYTTEKISKTEAKSRGRRACRYCF